VILEKSDNQEQLIDHLPQDFVGPQIISLFAMVCYKRD